MDTIAGFVRNLKPILSDAGVEISNDTRFGEESEGR